MVPISVKFSGVKITLQNREELKEFVIQCIYDEERFRIIMLDERKLFHSYFDEEFRNIIKNAEVVLCSSKTVAWAAKLLTKKEVPIILSVTLLLDMMRAADEMNYTVFLYGGNAETNKEATKRIRRSFPNARIVGNYHSRIKDKELDDVLVAIRKSSPQLFLVNLDSGKKQEKWIEQYKKYFSNSIIVGVDDAFKIISGRRKMPPIWVQQKGLTGVFRFISNPLDIPRFFRVIAIFFVTLYKRIFKRFD